MEMYLIICQGLTMPAITISGDDILATAASIWAAHSSMITLIGGISIALWIVQSIVDNVTSHQRGQCAATLDDAIESYEQEGRRVPRELLTAYRRQRGHNRDDTEEMIRWRNSRCSDDD